MQYICLTKWYIKLYLLILPSVTSKVVLNVWNVLINSYCSLYNNIIDNNNTLERSCSLLIFVQHLYFSKYKVIMSKKFLYQISLRYQKWIALFLFPKHGFNSSEEVLPISWKCRGASIAAMYKQYKRASIQSHNNWFNMWFCPSVRPSASSS